MNVEVKVDVEASVNRAKQFNKELEELCKKYGFYPEFAQDDETNETFIVVNVKNFIRQNDFKIQPKKEEKKSTIL